MLFDAILYVNGESLVRLFTIEASKDEIQNIRDAVNCELKYGCLNLDF